MLERKFEDALILGGGFAGKVAALALVRRGLNVRVVERNLLNLTSMTCASELSGKLAHSHIFLPRLLSDAQRALPDWLLSLERAGLSFSPGTRAAGNSLGCQRLFATRWQVEATLERQVAACPEIKQIHDRYVDYTMLTKTLPIVSSIVLERAGVLDISENTLVVDTMGGLSPLTQALVADLPGGICERSFVCYLTRFYRFEQRQPDGLPDALEYCIQKHPDYYMSLYPAAGKWFSVTVVIDVRNSALKSKLATSNGLHDLALEHPYISRWVKQAVPSGATRIYLDPKNTWYADVFETGGMPTNFCALGDALITSSPVLGAGCSFAVTHAAELVAALEYPDWQRRLVRAVRQAQYEIFVQSLDYTPPDGTLDSPRGPLMQVRRLVRDLPILSGIRVRRALLKRSTL